jgi:hypothetical protein
MNARAKTITLPMDKEPAARAELTGRLGETRVAGARVLVVEVEVHEPGRFHFYCDLCDDDGETLGYAERELELERGVTQVGLPIVFDVYSPRWGEYEVSGLRVVRRSAS